MRPDEPRLCRALQRRTARTEIAALGGQFGRLVDDPAALVLSEGYRMRSRRSIAASAVEFGSIRLPRWLLATLLRSLRDGYQVYVFESEPLPA